MYWTDALQDRIEASDLDGQSRSTVLAHATHPFGLTVIGSSIYWTDWYNKSIFRLPKNGNSASDEIRHGLRGALDIRSVSRSRQPNDYNPCSVKNGGCSHLCFYRRYTYVCACPDKPDKRTCSTKPSVIVPIMRPDSPDRPFRPTPIPPKDTLITPRFIITATIILGIILIMVVIAILVLVFKSRKKRGRKSSRTSSGSILTFTNPNYNVADGSGHSESSKGTIWRRFKYDKAQVSGNLNIPYISLKRVIY